MQQTKRWDIIWWLLLFDLLTLMAWAVDLAPPSCPAPCQCYAQSLTCRNLTSTSLFQTFGPTELSSIKSVTLSECDFVDGCLSLGDFSLMPALHKLKITQSNLQHFQCQPSRHNKINPLKSLKLLDLSNNKLQTVDKSISSLHRLSSINLSNNELTEIHSTTFLSLINLRTLDLSENSLTDPQVLRHLPPALQYLDISGNSWPCSPSLSWVWAWSRPLVAAGVLHNYNATQCLFSGSKWISLFSVMSVYSQALLPHCHPGCSCRLNYWADLNYNIEIEYNVAVNCSGLGLQMFPKLPEHTKKLDLSNNSLTSSAYENLNVLDDNYGRVQYLNISHNQLDSITNKFLKIMLRAEFTASHNQLTNIPYDFSKHLQKNTMKILLGNNPWICGCNAEINVNAENNKMLKDKIKDLEDIFCGLGSVPESVNQKQLVSIPPMVLCPPEDDGSLREVLLQLLCVVLAVLIVVVLVKLVYDFWIYRNRGKLPWIVLKMP